MYRASPAETAAFYAMMMMIIIIIIIVVVVVLNVVNVSLSYSRTRST